MYRFVFCPHPSSKNHGCEAIAISTNNILKRHISDAKTTLMTKYQDGDSRRGDLLAYSMFDKVVCVGCPQIKRFSLDWINYRVSKLFGKDKLVQLSYKSFLRHNKNEIKDSDVLISIGGDNFCYGRPVQHYAYLKAFKELGKRAILYGCSIEPSCISKEMLSYLEMYDLIVTRESLTYKALCEKGLNNVKLYPDPAFTLPRSDERIHSVKENTIGINVSPMIIDFASDSSKALMAYKKMVEDMLSDTDCNIAFIPHVTASTSDDRVVLKMLYDMIANKDKSERITIYDDMDCTSLKSIISQLRFFVGARTHATIAAYSSSVPTLVCGYSVKAKGIAMDIFGTYENYVIPVQSIKSDNELSDAFRWMYNNEDSIRNRLSEKMPQYIQKSWDSGEEFINVCK